MVPPGCCASALCPCDELLPHVVETKRGNLQGVIHHTASIAINFSVGATRSRGARLISWLRFLQLSMEADAPAANAQPAFVCPHCGESMIIIDTFARGQHLRA